MRESRDTAPLDPAFPNLDKLLVEHSPYCIHRIDLEGRFMEVNPAGLRMMEVATEDAVRGVFCLDVVADEDRERVGELLERALKHGETSEFDFKLAMNRRAMRSNFVPMYDDEGRLVSLMGITQDISEKVQLEERLRTREKLEGLGLLAGGVAHDFNNLLLAMIGNTELALTRVRNGAEADRGESLAPLLERVLTTADVAAGLCTQLLTYAGSGSRPAGAFELSLAIQEISEILQSSLPANVTLARSLPTSLPAVAGDRRQVQQVALNLIMNAAEACAKDGGRVSVAASVQSLGRADLASLHPECDRPSGDYACFEVVDNGAGLDPHASKRIFDPFYTTKPKGRGLGLATTLGILRSHRGGLEVDSSVGVGTRMRVFLPIASASARTDSTAAAAEPASLEGRRVLVVDDEPSIRTAVANLLATRGITALVAPDGIDACRILETAPSEIDAALLDMTLPGSSGDEVSAALRAIRSDLPILFMSGRAVDDDLMERFQPPRVFLTKPFRATTLEERLRELLGDSSL